MSIDDMYETKYHYLDGLGVTISAFSDGGYPPSGVARIVDTQKISALNSSTHFGSPNGNCSVSGPGVGLGGEPMMVSSDGSIVSNPMANCEGLANVLIAQEGNTTNPVANPGGSEIVFDMETPGHIVEVTLFNVLNNALNNAT
jgi:hypothetical protein